MTEATYPGRTPPLRRDLKSIASEDRGRAQRIIVDEISGRFARVSEAVWRALQSDEAEDPTLWQEARQAGWTRERIAQRSSVLSLIYFRLPIARIDGIASWLAALSWPLFSRVALMAWSVVVLFAFALALNHHAALVSSIGSLQQFLSQTSPFGLAVVIVGTKIVHELGHAVMCRRMGARCGEIGLLLLGGVPCPYCNVTDIWRQPSALRRAAVMLAGIYLELIIAALATFVWLIATDPTIRLHALNVMVVCSVSTIVFNANPLMRYDGYYVLADLMGSANLRREASESFRAMVTSRIAGKSYDAPRRYDSRSLFLAGYHATATLYRLAVVIAIATVCLQLAESFHLRPLAMGVVIVAMIAWVTRSIHRVGQAARGAGRWSRVPQWRRSLFALAVVASLAALLLIPIPRYRSTTGWVDAADTSTVFLPIEGVVQRVAVDLGQPVQSGDTLVDLQSDEIEIEHARLRGELRVARLRSSVSRRVTLDGADAADRWKTLQAAEEAVTARLASVSQRREQTTVTAPIGGIVLPVQSSPPSAADRFGSRLADRMGSATGAHDSWCRISPNGKLYAVLVIDARDRGSVDVGCPVHICLTESPHQVIPSRVIAVSAIDQDHPSVTRRAAYQVLCPLPEVELSDMLQWTGKECHGTFVLPRRALSSDLAHWIVEWLGGQPTTS